LHGSGATVVDLMDALKRSVGGRGKPARSGSTRSAKSSKSTKGSKASGGGKSGRATKPAGSKRRKAA